MSITIVNYASHMVINNKSNKVAFVEVSIVFTTSSFPLHHNNMIVMYR